MTMFASADAYDRFMGRFSVPLGVRFADLVAPMAGQSALDVGCGPGALTGELVKRLGAASVRAVDPTASFVDAARERFPGVDVRVASAESLPFDDGTFDLALSQLVVHFMSDPVAGIREMARVTKAGGLVAANVWDFEGRRGPLGVFERACLDLDPTAPTERSIEGTASGQLASIFERAELEDVWSGGLSISVEFATFEEWWQPFTLGVGPAGAYVASLDDDARTALAERCRELLPDIPFAIEATAWTATGRVPGALRP